MLRLGLAYRCRVALVGVVAAAAAAVGGSSSDSDAGTTWYSREFLGLGEGPSILLLYAARCTVLLDNACYRAVPACTVG